MMDLQNLFYLIKLEGMTLKEFSEKVNISQSILSEWKNGNRKPSLSTIIKVADVFNCSVDYLIGRTNDPKSVYVGDEIYKYIRPGIPGILNVDINDGKLQISMEELANLVNSNKNV